MESYYLLLALLVGAAADCHLSGPLDIGRALAPGGVEARIPDVTAFSRGTLQVVEHYDASYTNNDFCSGEHASSHLDAPFHFNQSGWTVEQIPVERLIANGMFLNVTAEAAGNASFRLQPSHIDAWIERHGPLPPNAVLLVSYGWAQRFHDLDLYTGTNSSSSFSDFSFPGLSHAAADRLAQIEQLVGYGMDTYSTDPPGSSYNHVTLAAKNIYNLEQLDLDQPCLPAKGFKVIAMPAKIVGGTGAPARVVLIPDATA